MFWSSSFDFFICILSRNVSTEASVQSALFNLFLTLPLILFISLSHTHKLTHTWSSCPQQCLPRPCSMRPLIPATSSEQVNSLPLLPSFLSTLLSFALSFPFFFLLVFLRMIYYVFFLYPLSRDWYRTMPYHSHGTLIGSTMSMSSLACLPTYLPGVPYGMLFCESTYSNLHPYFLLT